MAGWGWSLRRLTATEKVAGTDAVSGAFVRRGCRHCAAEAEYLGRYFVEVRDAAGLTRREQHRRPLCEYHATRFAERHELRPPVELPVHQVEQQILPLGGE